MGELGKDSVGKGSPWLPWAQTAWLLPRGRKGVGEGGRADPPEHWQGAVARGGTCAQVKSSKENLTSATSSRGSGTSLHYFYLSFFLPHDFCQLFEI